LPVELNCTVKFRDGAAGNQIVKLGLGNSRALSLETPFYFKALLGSNGQDARAALQSGRALDLKERDP